MSSRYAIYYTPAPDSALWKRVSAWLGHDSHLNSDVARPDSLNIALTVLRAATAKPARYGCHATLVAPFDLADGRTEDELATSMAAFCRGLPAFNARLEVNRHDDFIALVPAESEPKLNKMAAACVHHFDGFRSPLSEQDLARRDTAKLSELEKKLLRRWGYAHVLEAFRFHLSLTDSLPETSLSYLQPILTSLLAESLQQPVGIDGLTLSKQPDRESPFRCLARCAFSAK